MLAIEQDPADLILYVDTKDVSQRFRILQAKTYRQDPYLFHFAVIGASHTVTIYRHDRFILREVLACIDLPGEVFLRRSLRSFPTSYRFAIEHYSIEISSGYDMPLPQSLGQEPRLLVEFPTMYGQIPVTCIAWETIGQMVCWRTLHSYPRSDGRVASVLTQSMFHNRENLHLSSMQEGSYAI